MVCTHILLHLAILLTSIVAAYAMIKGGKDTAKRIQATGAATFTKAGSAGVTGVKAVGNAGAAGLGKVGGTIGNAARIPGRKHSTTR